MLYKLLLIVVVVVAVSVATAVGKDGPKWKSPLIAGVIFLVALLILELLGIKEATGT